jgi:hypothetical protein
MIRFWRLNELTVDNLGLACTEDGLFLCHTPLIERRNSCFALRERGEIERLLKRAYQGALPVDRLMPGLATVAAALNADDRCLARIAAVHLQIPDLPSDTARNGMEAEDVLIKSVDWNPALHPRIDTAPNRGWFAPTDGASGVAPLPTIAKTEAGFYMNCEPVAVVPVTNIIRRGNPLMPTPKRNAFPPPVLPKYAGVKSWSKFMQGASEWKIVDHNGSYRIVPYHKDPAGGPSWVEDRDHKIDLPPSTTVDELVERMIAILQDTARK